MGPAPAQRQHDFVDHTALQLSDCEGNLDCLQTVQTQLLSEKHQLLAQFERGTFSRALNLADRVLGAEKYLQKSGIPSLQPQETSASYFTRNLSEITRSHSSVSKQVYSEPAYRQLEREVALRQANKTVTFMKEHQMTPYGPGDDERTVEEFYEQIADDNGNEKLFKNMVDGAKTGLLFATIPATLLLCELGAVQPPTIFPVVMGIVAGAALLGAGLGYAYYLYTSTPESQLQNAAWSVVAE